jgi:hypothetical protein
LKNRNLFFIPSKMLLKNILLLFLSFLCLAIHADNNFEMDKVAEPLSERDMTLSRLNVTTGGPYTYSQSKHHFYGTAFDGSYIDTYGCCCGASGSCRDNPSCQCQKNVGPLPQVNQPFSSYLWID